MYVVCNVVFVDKGSIFSNVHMFVYSEYVYVCMYKLYAVQVCCSRNTVLID